MEKNSTAKIQKNENRNQERNTISGRVKITRHNKNIMGAQRKLNT